MKYEIGYSALPGVGYRVIGWEVGRAKQLCVSRSEGHLPPGCMAVPVDVSLVQPSHELAGIACRLIVARCAKCGMKIRFTGETGGLEPFSPTFKHQQKEECDGGKLRTE